MHIIFKKLSLYNFRSITSFEQDFDKGMYLIKGSNGSGKSSLFESIYVCLFNKRLNSKSATSAIQKDKKSAKIELTLDINNDIYIISRVIGKDSNCSIFKNGSILSSNTRESDKIIEELIPQDSIKLSMLQDVDIKKIITEYVNVDNFIEKVKDILNNNVSVKINKLQTELNSSIDKQNIYTQQCDEISNQIINEKNKINQLEIYLKTNLNTVKQAESYIELSKVKKNFLSVYNSEYTKLVANINNQINNLNISLTNIVTTINSINNEYQNKINTINFKIQNFENEIQKQLYQLDKNNTDIINKYNLEISSIISSINNIQKMLNNIDTWLQKDSCPTCNQLITKETKDNLINQRQLKIDEINKYQIDVENIKKLIDEQQQKYQTEKYNLSISFDKTEYVQQINNLVDEKNTSILNLENEKKNILINIDNLKYEIINNDDINKQKAKESALKILNITEQDLMLNTDEYINVIKQYEEKQKELDYSKNHLIYLESNYNDKMNIILSLKKSINTDDLNKLIEMRDILTTWDNIRLLKKLVVKRLSLLLNSLIQNKYNKLLNVQIDISDNDEMVINVDNLNGETVLLTDLSQGETVLSKLVIYCALKELLSTNVYFSVFFLDEFLDKLDEENLKNVVMFLNNLNNINNIFIITHNTYALDLQVWCDIIDMGQKIN